MIWTGAGPLVDVKIMGVWTPRRDNDIPVFISMVYKGVIDPCNSCKPNVLTSTSADGFIAVDGMIGLVNPVSEHKS